MTLIYDHVLFCHVCLMHSMYDISWEDIKEKLKFELKCMLNKLIEKV